MAKQTNEAASVVDAPAKTIREAHEAVKTPRSAGKPIRVGDIVLVRSGYGQNSGVIDPTIHPALVTGVHPDGDLAVIVYGRSESRNAKMAEDATGTKFETWHRRPE